MKTISLAGQMQNGKTTVADYLLTKLSSYEKVSLATPVKQIFCAVFNVSHDDMEIWKRKEEFLPNFHKTVRESLIFIGDGFRQIKPDIWIDMLYQNNKNKNIIVDDVRYVTEVDFFNKHDGFNVLIYRPDHVNEINNQSEQDLRPYIEMLKDHSTGKLENLPFKFFLKNDGNLAKLFDQVDNLLLPEIQNGNFV